MPYLIGKTVIPAFHLDEWMPVLDIWGRKKKVNKQDEVQHKVNRSSQKYPTVPQLGFLFYQIPLRCSKNCMNCIYEHSCRGTFSHLTHRGHSGLKSKKNSWNNKTTLQTKRIYERVCDLESPQSSEQIFTLELPLNYLWNVLLGMGKTEC